MCVFDVHPGIEQPGPHLHPIFEFLGNSRQIVRSVQCGVVVAA
jgi:hypothetical protein